MAKSETIFLSVVIPAFNEERHIHDAIESIVEFLDQQVYTWEIVVANDGSTDKTLEVVSSFAKKHPKVKALNLPHVGKGNAVRKGMLSAIGEYRFMCDAVCPCL